MNYKQIVIISFITLYFSLLVGCSNENINTNINTNNYKKSEPVSYYARKHLYELGDIIDELDSLAISRNRVEESRIEDVIYEYEDYIESKVYEKYKHKNKTKSQQKEFDKISKVRKEVIKTVKKIKYDYEEDFGEESEEYAEKFIDKYEDKYDNFISKLYLKYAQ